MPHLNPDQPPPGRVVVFGGIYNNHLSLAATLAEAERLGADEIYCLGDMGGFGPSPDKVFPLLHGAGVRCMQGNYDHSVGNRLEDCACGYTDPRDNHFARISYDYTLARTSDANKDWLRALPTGFRHTWNGRQVVMAHGSTRRTNEFLWASTSPDHFLEHLLRDPETQPLLATAPPEALKSLGRSLRPIARLLGVDLPPALLLSPRPPRGEPEGGSRTTNHPTPHGTPDRPLPPEIRAAARAWKKYGL